MQAIEQDGMSKASALTLLLCSLRSKAVVLILQLGPIQCSTCASKNWQGGERVPEVLGGEGSMMMDTVVPISHGITGLCRWSDVLVLQHQTT